VVSAPSSKRPTAQECGDAVNSFPRSRSREQLAQPEGEILQSVRLTLFDDLWVLIQVEPQLRFAWQMATEAAGDGVDESTNPGDNSTDKANGSDE